MKANGYRGGGLKTVDRRGLKREYKGQLLSKALIRTMNREGLNGSVPCPW